MNFQVNQPKSLLKQHCHLRVFDFKGFEFRDLGDCALDLRGGGMRGNPKPRTPKLNPYRFASRWIIRSIGVRSISS